MKFPWVLLVLCLIAGQLVAQSLHFKHSEPGLQYGQLRYEAVYQSRDGLVWIGTDRGLFSYDGRLFFRYEGITGTITAIHEDADGALWIGFDDGRIGIRHLDSVKLWQPEEGLPKKSITGFATNRLDSAVWIATYGEGLYVWKNGRLYNFNMDDGLLSNDIYAVKADPHGLIWAGTDMGIGICSFKEEKKSIQHITKKENLPDEIIPSLHLSGELMWAGTFDRGMCAINTETHQVQNYDPPIVGVVRSIASFGVDEIWAAVEDVGLIRWNFKTNQTSNLAVRDLTNPMLKALFLDDAANIWLLDTHKGLFRGNRVLQYYFPPVKNIQALVFDDANNMFAGNQDGLFKMHVADDYTSAVQINLPDVNVVSLYMDIGGHLWIGTFGQGLIYLDPASGRYRTFFKSDGLTDESILSITGDGEHLWLATLGGVTQIEHSTDLLTRHELQVMNYNQEDGLGTNFIYTASTDRHMRTWFGTDGKGLSVLENGHLTNYQPDDSIEFHTVYSIAECAGGRIWFSTAENGVFQFDGSFFQQYGMDHGLRSTEIASITAGVNGDIYFTHNLGIDQYVAAAGIFKPYGEGVGLRGFSPNLNAGTRDAAGNVWIAGAEGLLKINNIEEELPYLPRNRFQSIRVLAEPIDYEEENVFPAHNNYLQFDYQGLWYIDADAVQYRYRLMGLDEEWKKTNETTAFYHNIPPGQYEFVLQSTSTNVFQEQNTISYAFRIKNPFYKTVPFILISGILLIMLIYSFIKAREKRLRKRAVLEKQQVESQLLALKSHINPHFLFNSFNTLVSIIEADSETAVEFVENLSDFYRSMLQYREKHIIPLVEEINLVRNYTYLLKKRFGANLRLEADIKSEPAFIAPLTLQILVENAVKHNIISKSKPLHISISCGNEHIVVQNNLQKKPAAKESTAYGLKSILGRYALLTDRPVEIKETREHFTVVLPIIQENAI